MEYSSLSQRRTRALSREAKSYVAISGVTTFMKVLYEDMYDKLGTCAICRPSALLKAPGIWVTGTPVSK